ncbi:isoprenylcysteine carboxyl methyltransferase (ICMT) family protein [bacterium BMS3Abin10]|nr:isoprenylcysteine carboxyl methyltransferase (ICMT) family protein [bacterium BMS3Abin10]GBE37459.1 isoprenylcysteine carboxyl methyltransferase (ICMT) family protein [bacterium BMS3Bbin08]HDH50442.1 isoprenylcysteine carboxylmethyltransferase family protein [Nitrospirota bacterium]HDK16327.1 isoprenylcysteine carboxylmethyltransferase family protein [Nitrospirota bacterium]HDZ88953.1 isoprenylcysteine carboxylmethyltransferase family protein [Nitrospirota bacterium]
MESSQPTLGGTWIITIIMVIVVSWIVFKYLVPGNFKEWRNFGLIQAFIIALYAEMYGFPLTIYLLTSFLGFDIPWLHVKGHLWASLLGGGDGMAMVEMLVGYTFVFLGLSLIVRGWQQIYEARKEDRLVTHSIYRYIRHPQYTGIYLAIFGQLIHWPTIPTLVLFPVIVVAYYTLARKEEKVMIERFGDEYRAYVKKVPMFFPGREKIMDIFKKDKEENTV